MNYSDYLNIKLTAIALVPEWFMGFSGLFQNEKFTIHNYLFMVVNLDIYFST